MSETPSKPQSFLLGASKTSAFSSASQGQPDTIDLLELGLCMLRYWKLFIMAAIIGGMAGFGYASYMIPKTYSSTETIFFTPKLGSDGNINESSISLNSKLMNNVLKLMVQDNILSLVAESVEGETIDSIRDSLTVENETGTELINVTSTTGDAYLSAEIVETTVDVFIDTMKDNLNVTNIEIVKPAKVADEANSRGIVTKTMLGALLASFMVAAGIGVHYLLDNRIRSKTQAEEYFGIPVFGEVPEFDMGGKS